MRDNRGTANKDRPVTIILYGRHGKWTVYAIINHLVGMGESCSEINLQSIQVPGDGLQFLCVTQ